MGVRKWAHVKIKAKAQRESGHEGKRSMVECENNEKEEYASTKQMLFDLLHVLIISFPLECSRVPLIYTTNNIKQKHARPPAE